MVPHLSKYQIALALIGFLAAGGIGAQAFSKAIQSVLKMDRWSHITSSSKEDLVRLSHSLRDPTNRVSANAVQEIDEKMRRLEADQPWNGASHSKLQVTFEANLNLWRNQIQPRLRESTEINDELKADVENLIHGTELSIILSQSRADSEIRVLKYFTVFLSLFILPLFAILLFRKIFASRDIERASRLDHELKAANEQLLQTAKLASIGELAAGIGHEINNPLSIISGNVDRMRKELKGLDSPPSEIQKSLERQTMAIRRITNIVNGLRTFARTSTDEYENHDAHKLVQESHDLMKGMFEAEGIQLTLALNAEQRIIVCNWGKFQQVLMNLLQNAKDATEGRSSRRVEISTSSQKGLFLLEVRDNGMGIAEENRGKIFDAFYTTKSVGKGTGLGLGLTASFVRDMKGTIDFESEVEVGTSFKVAIPLSNVQFLTTPHQKTALKSTKLKGRALVVDDEPEIRMFLRQALEDMGLAVEEAENGKVALDKFLKSEFTHIFTDIKMPVMSGDQLIREVKATQKPVHIVAVTGGVRASDVIQKAMDDADAVVLKPFCFDKLFQAAFKKERAKKRFKALVVEDEPLLSEIVKEWLEEIDFDVDEAGDGQSALNKALRKRYDVIVTDLGIPELSGDRLVRELRKVYEAQIFIVLATGEDRAHLASKFGESFIQEIDGLITKPYDGEEVQNVIGSLLGISKKDEEKNLAA